MVVHMHGSIHYILEETKNEDTLPSEPLGLYSCCWSEKNTSMDPLSTSTIDILENGTF